jgi:DNA repair exonuclease SbcCD ATPase subunit
MRLERVSIEGFGPISRFETALEPRRLNLLIGPNESGKSSFASAVVATLFGFSSHEAELRSKPWNGGRHAASLTLEVAGARYRVSRDFSSHEVEVARLKGAGDEVESVEFRGAANPRGRGPERSQYDELLQGWFGFTDPRLFRESCFVHESALETEVSPELRHLISGAVETDYQQIQEALLDRLDALTREHPFDVRARKRVNRSIETRIERLEQLRARRTRSVRVLGELKSTSSERDAVESRLRDLRADLVAKEQLLAGIDSMIRLREEQRKLLKRAPDLGEELVRARRARARLEEIDRRIAESFAYLQPAPEESEQDLTRLGFLRTQRSRHQKTAEAGRTRLEGTRPPSPILAIGLGTILGAALAGGAYFLWPAIPATWIAAGIGGCLVGIGIAMLFGSSASRTRSTTEAQVRVAEENIRTLSQEIDAIEFRVSPLLAGRPLDVVLADFKQALKLQQERREHLAVVQSLPTPERLETESREIDEAVGSLRAKEKALCQQAPFLQPLREDPVQAGQASDRLKRESTALKTRIDAEQEALERVTRRGGGESEAENVTALEDQIAFEEEALRVEERQRDALMVALEVLRDSVQEYQEEHVGRLSSSTGKTLARLTHERYGKVVLDADLTPTLTLDGRGDVALESLSRGARDAFYFALRAALAKELAAREPLPLLLDDPIAHLDEERRGVLIGYLEELAQEIQVILLTHDRRVLNQVREAHVVALGTDSAASPSARKIRVR